MADEVVQARAGAGVVAGIDVLDAAEVVLEVGDRIEAELGFDEAGVLLDEGVGDFAVGHLVADADHAADHFLHGRLGGRIRIAAIAGVADLLAKVAAGGDPARVQGRGRGCEVLGRGDQIGELALGEIGRGLAAAFVIKQVLDGVEALEGPV